MYLNIFYEELGLIPTSVWWVIGMGLMYKQHI